MHASSDSAALSALAESLSHLLAGDALLTGQVMARYTTIGIGGPADLLAVATSTKVLRNAVTMAWDHGVPCTVLGAGSNVLISDVGIRGLVVVNRAREFKITEETLRADSGAILSAAARQTIARSLEGIEWAIGIPGTVGGAIVGNAGAWGGDIASALVWARVLGPDASICDWPAKRFEFGYRSSVLKNQADGQKHRPVVLEAEFQLRSRSRERLESRVADIMTRRKQSQPPGASCGSVFRNPPGDYAGRLIEAAGLKGRRSGEAEISTVHANFVINHGNAKASDVRSLIHHARREVQAQFGVTLELEIQMLGDWCLDQGFDSAQ